MVISPGAALERLPSDFRSVLPVDRPGMLLVPDRGVPIHPESIRRFARAIEEGVPAYYVPEIPISTKLGLPRYEPLLYWMPKSSRKQNFFGTLLQRLRRNGAVHSAQLDPISVVSHPQSRRLVEATQEEQVHYFADYFPVLCPKPIQVSVILSNTCNLKCIMCPYHSTTIRATHTTDFFAETLQMKWEMMDRIAYECGELRLPVKVGNIEEPLLHPRIVEFVRACRSRGAPSFHITTNGLPVTEEKIRELFDAGLTSIYVSMDAARPATYLRVRGASLERLEANVRKMIAIREAMKAQCTIRTSFVKNRGVTLEEADEFRERWVGEADGVIFYNLAEYEGGNSRFVEIHRFVDELMKNAGGRWPCLSPFQEVYLLPDGRVYYCCETVSKLAFEKLPSMGSYPEQSIQQIWAGEMFTHLRRDLICNRLDNWSACQDCGIWMAHAGQVIREGGLTISRNMITEIVDRN